MNYHLIHHRLLFVPVCEPMWAWFAAGGMGAQAGPRRSRPIPGEDERYDIQLDFLDAVFGTQYVPPLPYTWLWGDPFGLWGDPFGVLLCCAFAIILPLRLCCHCVHARTTYNMSCCSWFILDHLPPQLLRMTVPFSIDHASLVVRGCIYTCTLNQHGVTSQWRDHVSVLMYMPSATRNIRKHSYNAVQHMLGAAMAPAASDEAGVHMNKGCKFLQFLS